MPFMSWVNLPIADTIHKFIMGVKIKAMGESKLNNSPGVVPSSFMLSIMVISLFNLAIDSCSFPLDRKSLLKPGIIP